MILPQPLRRLQWKLGRRLYMAARGEPRSNLPDSSDERYVQASVLAATSDQEKLTVLDVGANKGQWSSQFLRLATEARRRPGSLALHAFEPVPATRELCEGTIAGTQGRECVFLHALALSDSAGIAPMAIWNETAGTNTLSFDDTSVTRAKRVLQIETQTLDAFLSAQEIDHVTLLKIDAEGHDFSVLKGGESALREERIDVVQFEYSHRWIYSRAFLRDMFRFVENTPYILARIRNDRLELLTEWHPELERYFDANFALIHPRAEGWFEIHKGRFDGSNSYA